MLAYGPEPEDREVWRFLRCVTRIAQPYCRAMVRLWLRQQGLELETMTLETWREHDGDPAFEYEARPHLWVYSNGCWGIAVPNDLVVTWPDEGPLAGRPCDYNLEPDGTERMVQDLYEDWLDSGLNAPQTPWVCKWPCFYQLGDKPCG